MARNDAPLTGEDAERLVEYIGRPVVPPGHNEYLKGADETYRAIRPREGRRKRITRWDARGVERESRQGRLGGPAR